MSNAQPTEVLYNEACPVCSREIDHYARITKEHAVAISFADLNVEQTCAAWNMTPDEAARRLHVRKDGKVYNGVPAFLVLWQDIPRYRWLARLVGLPGVRQVATFVYDRVLAPGLYAYHRRQNRKSKV